MCRLLVRIHNKKAMYNVLDQMGITVANYDWSSAIKVLWVINSTCC